MVLINNVNIYNIQINIGRNNGIEIKKFYWIYKK